MFTSTSTATKKTLNLPLPLELRIMIWDLLLPPNSNTIFTPGPLSLNHTIRAEYLPLALTRVTIDLCSPPTNPLAPPPRYLHHAQHLLISPSIPTWTSLPNSILCFPHLQIATLTWPTPPEAHGTTLAGLLGSSVKNEAWRYAISALFRLRWLSNAQWVTHTDTLKRAVEMRRTSRAPSEGPMAGEVEARVRLVLAGDATVTVGVAIGAGNLQRWGLLRMDDGEEKIELMGPLKLWGVLCKGRMKLRDMGGTEEMSRLYTQLMKLELKLCSEFRGHLRYAMKRGLVG